jgi:hypothetical protein
MERKRINRIALISDTSTYSGNGILLRASGEISAVIIPHLESRIGSLLWRYILIQKDTHWSKELTWYKRHD